MGAGAGQCQHQKVVVNAIDQKSIGSDVALAKARPISRKRVISVRFGELFAARQRPYDVVEQRDVEVALHRGFIVFF